ncbi:class I adenylate-forming enzyme family protein [Ferroplasma sp.]|uniref:class I adenylate-forming enzyme family protein n=1 Tax=Ferroplasma sp. TaxID=2591003 RepID=UPI00307D02A3
MIEALNGHVNIPNISAYALLERNTEVNGSRPAIIFYEKYITYSKLLRYIDSMAYQLQHVLNVKKGDIIGIAMDYSPQYIISMLSCFKIGAAPLIIDGNLDEKTINEYAEKHGINVIVICKKFVSKAINEKIKYIVSDPDDFLTLGKAIIYTIKHYKRIKYGKNILKFFEFIYSGNNDHGSDESGFSEIMFYIHDKLFVFTVKKFMESTFILNYWLPKFDARPKFFSSIVPSTPLGIVYSLLLPFTFSGTIIIDKISSISRTTPDFLIGNPDFYSKIMDIKTNIFGVKYCIMPFFAPKIENALNKFTKIPLIMGRSDEYTLTTHINPFDDIRKGSFGIPLSYVECKLDDENNLLLKTPFLPSVYENGVKSHIEWYNTNIRVQIIDKYYYAL